MSAVFVSYLQLKTFSTGRLRQINPERLINFIWSSYMCFTPTYHGRFNRTMLTVGSDGDTTRWKSYDRNVPVSYLLRGSSTVDKQQRANEHRIVRLKYTAEFGDSKKNCHLV